MKKILPQYQGYFHPTHDDDFGLVTFLSQDITVHDSGSFSLYDGMQLSPNDKNMGRIAQWFSVTQGAQNYMILNMHGYHTKTGKGDIPERLIQSQNIIKHAEKFINNDIPVIVCGDFNLRSDTESIAMFNTYFKNLINMYNVQNTRTSYYTRDEKFADYIFISNDLHEKEFKCIDEEVSDHAALYVEV